MSEMEKLSVPYVHCDMHALKQAKKGLYKLLLLLCYNFSSLFFQVLFLFCIFGYLVIMIFYKWIAINVNSSNVSI